MPLTNTSLVQRVRLGKVIGHYYTSLTSSTTMPKKHTLPRTKNDNTKVQKVSLSHDETQSPFFTRTDGGSEARGSRGKEKKVGSRQAKKSPHITLPAPPITLPDPLITLPAPLVTLPPLAHPWGPGRRLTQHFYDQECIPLAKALLGKVAVRLVGGRRVSARVVETECYLGVSDEASHTYKGKRTRRNEPMYMKAGTSYVYSIYGMYYCFNVCSKEEGACVLVRAGVPLEGMEVMVQGRSTRRGPNSPPLKLHQLCNGPSKLCQALALSKESTNKLDLVQSDVFWMEEEVEEDQEEAGGGGVPEDRVVISTRIGIESSGPESANKPLRFYVLGDKCVSVRDKQAEKNMLG